MKRLSRAHREDDDDDADADDDAFFSRATFDGVVSALFYTRAWGRKCVFFLQQTTSETTENRDLKSHLNEISFPRKALFRLFVSSADREPPDGIKKLQKGWISH